MADRPQQWRSWAGITVLAAAVGLGFSGVRWALSPARLRPSTLPEGGRLIHERLEASATTSRTFGRATHLETTSDTYFMHIDASEGAFAEWMRSLDVPELLADGEPDVRTWMDPPGDRCIRILTFAPADRYGVLAIACH